MKSKFILLCFISINLNVFSQKGLSFFLNYSNSTLLNKTPEYSQKGFNSVGDFEARQIFYGNLTEISSNKTVGFGLGYKLPFKKKNISYTIILSSLNIGHREKKEGGLALNYPYVLAINYGDSSNITIENKINNYFLNVGLRVEHKIHKKISFEIEPSFAINKSNNRKIVKTFRSIFSTRAGRNSDRFTPYTDVNYNGIIFLKAGINYDIFKRIKMHLNYFRAITPVNKYQEFSKLYYSGATLQISYFLFKN